MSKPIYVLDSCALLAFFHKEKGWEVMNQILFDVRMGEADIVIHKINLIEVYYYELRNSGEEFAYKTFKSVSNLLIKVENDLSDEFSKTVSHFKINYKVSFADCFALALAKKMNAPLITSDHHEFDIIDKKKFLKFIWIR